MITFGQQHFLLIDSPAARQDPNRGMVFSPDRNINFEIIFIKMVVGRQVSVPYGNLPLACG
ncbi:MAG: hypothetical protein ACE5G1_10560 [bacterium]